MNDKLESTWMEAVVAGICLVRTVAVSADIRTEGLLNTNLDQGVRPEVLTAVVMKSTIFWVITLCKPLRVNRRFGGIYRLHLQGLKSKPSKKPT
jgi:hypothetical protein